MRCFLSNLTAALLALHTVLGCCLHHAHALAGDRDSAPSIESPDRHKDHCADGCGSNESENHERHVCQGNAYIFLGPTKWDRHRLQLDIAALSVAPLLGCQPVIIASVRTEQIFEPDALLPPLRLHLLDRVLLL